MPRDTSIKSVLIIGSGPIVIGQACEFDYAGSQASRSLREEGIEVTLTNSNPATIMTDSVTADNIYLLPLDKKSIIQILEKHKIDAVLPTMGGQTALNLAIDCDKAGIWKKYGVKMIGVDIGAIEFIHRRLIELRDAGKAILLVSVELDEIRSLSDRILVMFDGQVMGERKPETDEQELGLLMAGVA